MKNILILTPHLPWPLNSGGNVGVFYMLKAIGDYANITVMTAYNRDNNYTVLNELQTNLPKVRFDLYNYLKRNNKKYEIWRKLAKRIDIKMKFGCMANRNNLNVMDLVTPDYIEYINDFITKNKIDIVQIEFAEYLPFVYSLPDTVKKIFIHHELRWVRNELLYGDSICDRFFKAYMKDNEIAMLNRFDKIVSLTDIDKEKLLKEKINVPVEVSTLIISNITEPYKEQRFNNILSFVGGSTHYPNYDGIKWFVNNVYPAVLSIYPNVKLRIIGKWDENRKKEIQGINSSIEFMGFVDNLYDGIKDSIMVVPINVGSGMRMKILEAANYSIPFVSTVVGVEGLKFKSGYDCFIAKDSVQMADQICNLISDANLLQDISKKAHDTFEKRYSVKTLTEHRLKVYE